MDVKSKKIRLLIPSGVNVQVEFNYTDSLSEGEEWFYAEDVSGKLIPADSNPSEAEWSGKDGVRTIRISVPKDTNVQVEYSYTSEQGVGGSWFSVEDITSIWARDEPVLGGTHMQPKICLP